MPDGDLIDLLRAAPPRLRDAFIDGLAPGQAARLLARLGPAVSKAPATPLGQGVQLDDRFRIRPHLELVADRFAAAVADVEAGNNRRLVITTPPRSGKSTLMSIYAPLWALRRNPDWKIALLSYDIGLVTSWSRAIRTMVENNALGVTITPDGGAAGTWTTTAGGGVIARSMGMPLTGYGAKLLLIDDAVKDFAEAHSATHRDALWNWWLSVAQTRLEPPALVAVTMTRWHEADIVARLLSDEYEGDPSDWEVIRIPAVADSADDPLGRELGAPLLSPLLEETADQAAGRWAQTKRDVGSYTWAALYQQSPAPAAGAIFDIGRFHYWTHDPGRVSDTVHWLDPDKLAAGTWLDSWDAAFKGTDDSDFVVGQRWVRIGPNRILVDQTRSRWTFTETIREMERWSDPHLTRHGRLVHKRVIEDKANGPAIIDTLKKKVSGIKPFNPKTSKEARYRAVTPEGESGHVWLPHPSEYPWVRDLLDELRDAPHGANDDMCLVGSTRVETPGGPRRLDAVRAGDCVLGATGWVTTEAAGMTSPAAGVIERCGLVGTPSHPVWTEARGWVPLARVKYNDKLWMLAQSKIATDPATPEAGAKCTTSAGLSTVTPSAQSDLPEKSELALTQTVTGFSPQRPALDSVARTGYLGQAPSSNRSSTGGSPFAGIPTRANPATGATSSPGVPMPREAWSPCTERFTRTTTDLFLTGGISTTSTKTSTTTIPAILKRSRQVRIMPSILEELGLTRKLCQPISHGSERWHPSGTVPMRAENGTASTQSSRTSAGSRIRSAGKSIGLGRMEGQSGLGKPHVVDGRRVEPVFNLKTSDGTYFANGVLVHNCDAYAMALLELRDSGSGTVTLPRTARAVPARVVQARTARHRRIS